MHIDDLDVTQIRLLAELSLLRNVSAAARRIGLSQSAASHALARLRRLAGDPLFLRMENGVQPTPFGDRLGAAARQAVEALLTGLVTNAPFNPATTARQFNIFMSDVGQMVFLPRLLAFLKREAPGATLRSLPVPLDNPAMALASGEVDLAVGFFTNLLTGFQQSLLFRERYVCAVRAGHPSFQKGMTREAFETAEHAIADSSGMAHAVIERVLRKNRIGRAIALRVPEFHVLPMIIAESDLVVIMPSRLAKAFEPHIPIMLLPTPVPIPAYDIRVYWHERFHRDASVRWLQRAFTTLFRERR